MKIPFLRIRLICMLFIMSVAFGMIITSVGGQSTTKLYVDPPKTECWIPAFGENFMVNVTIANVSDLQSFEFKLYWNTTLLDLVEAELHSFLNPLWVPTKNEINETLGRYWLNETSVADPPGKSGSGPLVTLTFKIMHCGPIWPENLTCALDLADTELADSNRDLISHEVYDGEYICYSTSLLSLTTITDKPVYNANEIIHVYGNLTLEFSPVQDGLVALEIDNPLNQVTVIRTLSTGNPPADHTVEIVEVTPCGGPPNYNPRDWFYIGTTAHFNVTVKNNDNEPRMVLATINVYDVNLTPLIALSVFKLSIPSGSTSWGICSFYIPDTASIGNSSVYASALTEWPRDGGTAYCPEENATFEIRDSVGAGSTTGSPQTSGNSPEGMYNLTFKLPSDARVGIHRVWAGGSYQELSTTSGTAFGVSVILVPDHYPTIQAAVNAASPTNKSILVMPKTYNEHVNINKPLTLVGRDPRPGRTIIDGSGTGTVVTATAGNVMISGFTVQNGGSSLSDSGITLKNSIGSTISENTILKNYYGINVHSSDSNSIRDNTLLSNNYGIYLNHSTSITLKNNNMMCNKYNFGVFGDSISHFTHDDIDTSNAVNGKPLIYWVDEHNREVPSNAGFVAIVKSTNIFVRGLDLTKNVQGVLLAFTNSSVIERVNTLSNEYGIYLAYSHGNLIIGSEVSNNFVGIYQRNSDENIIYHNNFINNINQVERYQSSNTWDDDGIWLCPICEQPQPKGNYWSDYTGLDDGTPTQTHNCPGDGVGDTNTPHLGVDKYPLMEPWIIVHDISITSVTYVTPYNAPHVYAWPDWAVTVTVTIKNKGDSVETFTVTAYANTTIIRTQPVTLPVTSSTPIISTWEMDENIAKGYYTISANATTVPDETYTTDNIYVDGGLLVAGIGDANADKGVDIIDLTIVALALWSEPGDENWDPRADMSCDGLIDIVDLTLVSTHLWETW